MEDENRTREVRAAKNQALFREVNEHLKGLAEAFRFVAETSPFTCECANLNCFEQLALTIDDYERVRANPTHFVVLPGHVVPEVEDVVATRDGYVVVAKRNAGAEMAKAADPRVGTS